MSPASEQPIGDAADTKWWLHWLLPGTAGMLAIVLIAAYIWNFNQLPVNENPAAWGTFGDYVGGLLNPLISLFTLVVAVSVWNLQKTELLETRKVVREQGKTAEQQRCEQRFFDLLNLYQETLKTFVVEGATGKAALNNWQKLSDKTKICELFISHGWDEFDAEIPHGTSFEEKVRQMHSPQKIRFTKQRICNSWNAFSPQLDHYFRTIFSILGELEKLLGSDHWRYAKLFRAQLSRDELTLLTFNLLFDEEGEKMRLLVAKYGLLKHLAKTKLRDHAIVELDSKSFGLAWVNTQKVLTPREELPC